MATRPAPPDGFVPSREPVLIGPAPTLTDAELAARIAAGDRWAEEALYRRFVPGLFCTVRRLLGNTAEAEDVIQDTFATAFEIWGQLREPSRVGQWLMRIAVHKVHRRFRRRKLLRALGLDGSVDDATLELCAPTGATAEWRAELGRLDRVLATLPVAERIAWMLRYVEGLSLEEVAVQCDCSLATAKRRIAVARRRVAEHVGMECSDE